jgi:hypothetical protein
MKHIKRFNESLDNDIKSYLKNVFLELEDLDIKPYIEDSVHNKLTIFISKLDILNQVWAHHVEEPFDLSQDVIDCFHHFTDYLEENNYRLNYLGFKCKDSDGVTQIDTADNLDDLKRLISVFGYNDFINIKFIYRRSWK